MTTSEGSPSEASVAVVVGANGGAGASLVAGALALAWARAGTATWLLELDLGRGDRGDAWDLPAGHTLDDLVGVAGELDDGHLLRAAQDPGGGLRVLLAPTAPGSAGAWTSEAVGGLIRAARAACGAPGRVVVDGGAGLAGPALAASALSQRTLIVCGPTVGAARRARRLVAALASSGGDGRCGLVVCDRPGEREIGGRALGRAVGADVLAELPWSPGEAGRLRVGRWPTGRRARLAAGIEAIAEALA